MADLHHHDPVADANEAIRAHARHVIVWTQLDHQRHRQLLDAWQEAVDAARQADGSEGPRLAA